MHEFVPKAAVRMLALVSLAAIVAGCGQSPARGAVEGTGLVSLGLQIAPGNTVSQGTYTIVGADGFVSAGSFTLGDDPDVPVVLSHLPIASGYEIEATATASDGVTVCEGSAVFDVTDANTSTVIVHLSCGVPTGDVNLVANVNLCPMLDSVGANPNEVRLGGTVALASSAHDTDHGPSALSYQWRANGLVLKQQQPNLNFSCSSKGFVDFSVTVSDGDPSPGCADSLAVRVECSAP